MIITKSRLSFLLVFLLALVPAYAVNRTLKIVAPAEATPGNPVAVLVSAGTDAADGEQIGFLHVQYSNDDGKTWQGLCFESNVGEEWSRRFDLVVGDKGKKVIIRARAAFRDGKAGDVDFNGGAIGWNDTWEKWLTPPTRYAIVPVTGR